MLQNATRRHWTAHGQGRKPCNERPFGLTPAVHSHVKPMALCGPHLRHLLRFYLGISTLLAVEKTQNGIWDATSTFGLLVPSGYVAVASGMRKSQRTSGRSVQVAEGIFHVGKVHAQVPQDLKRNLVHKESGRKACRKSGRETAKKNGSNSTKSQL